MIHNHEVGGSSPPLATKNQAVTTECRDCFFIITYETHTGSANKWVNSRLGWIDPNLSLTGTGWLFPPGIIQLLCYSSSYQISDGDKSLFYYTCTQYLFF